MAIVKSFSYAHSVLITSRTDNCEKSMSENKNNNQSPVSSSERSPSEEHDFRVKKAHALREKGIEPWPYAKDVSGLSAQVLDEFVEEGNYDSDYYVKNQVLPAVIKIVRELGYTEQDLIEGGKQTGLGAWS